MKKLIKLGLIIAGAAALTFTMASASEEEAPKTTKCQGDKSGGKNTKCNGNKDTNKTDSKCNAGKDTKKAAPEKGKCGTGKCG